MLHINTPSHPPSLIPIYSDSIALTAILDADGVLSTPDITDRFGFAISDPIRSDAKNSNGPGDAKTKPRVVPLRNEAKISINLKSDGNQSIKHSLFTTICYQ